MIVRTPHRERYVVISKIPLEDERLSWKARGILAYLLSKPDNWTVMVAHLVNQSPEGEKSVWAGLKELTDAGYITREAARTGGKFAGMEYYIHEEPLGSHRTAKKEVRHRTAINGAPLMAPLMNNEVNDKEESFFIDDSGGAEVVDMAAQRERLDKMFPLRKKKDARPE